ncbi:MAG: hypothetical protein U0174_03805 [Polyangiaceae bacterium]
MDTAHPLWGEMAERRLPNSSRRTANGSATAEARVTEEPASDTQLRSIENPRAKQRVTLVVYGWNNAQPGTLSWTFPNARTALVAARALTNAREWAILAGDSRDVEAARKRGEVLFEA